MSKFTLIEVFACGHARNLTKGPALEMFCATAMTQIPATGGRPNCLYTNEYCPLAACQAQDFDSTVCELPYDVDEHVRLDLLRDEYSQACQKLHQVINYMVSFDMITQVTWVDLCLPLPFSTERNWNEEIPVVFARMEEAIRSRAPRVTYEANATHAAFLLHAMNANTQEMCDHGCKLAELQSQLDLAGLLRNTIYTPEDVEKRTNIYWAACGEPIEREKIAMRIFQPRITDWSHVSMPASSVDDSGYDSDDEASGPASFEEEQASAGQDWMTDPNSHLHPCFKSTRVQSQFLWDSVA